MGMFGGMPNVHRNAHSMLFSDPFGHDDGFIRWFWWSWRVNVQVKKQNLMIRFLSICHF